MQQIEIRNLCEQFLLEYCKACSERKITATSRAKNCLSSDNRIDQWDHYFGLYLDGNDNVHLILYVILMSNKLIDINNALTILRNR